MTSGYLLLLKQDFSDCEEASTAWHKLSTHMDELGDRHRTKVTGPLHANWSGDDAASALYYLENLEGRFGIVRTEAMAISEAIAQATAKMFLAQSHLRETVKELEGEDFYVDDDGAVHPPKDREYPQDGETRQDRFDLFTKLENYQTAINGCVERAQNASDEAARALGVLGGDILTGNVDDAAGEAREDVKQVSKALHNDIGKPYPPSDPKDAAEWWKNLPESQRETYAALHPEILGKTDGLPAGVRDDTNRLALEQELSAMENYEYHDKFSTDEYNKRLNNLQTLQAELDKRDGATGEKQIYMLGFDSKGDGKTVIGMGNPDTADNVGVFVPGTSTTVSDSTGVNLIRMDKLQNAAGDADHDAKTSMIFWLGYDAPEIPGSQAGNLDVAGTGRAEGAAPDLRHFTHGLRASHEGAPANLTVLGHSYGSTVVGAGASGGGGLDADNIAVVGSPGMTVDRATELNIDPDHVYVGLAEDDGISAATDLTLGADPSAKSFGGHRFKVDTHEHSGYWDMTPQGPSQSLANQGKIIAGVKPTLAS
ncbi:alpha/beta hydrolase [Streptomyces noursei]|uniref:alpha/beta hydrolase n=1 Tax=Streptomyces noursei TaxID=1971 RepID=UPI001677E282|nr:alpha/beta hydrolase [Streptomyces noursei]MCZ1015440.1 alpha/beta hydrolase [Streptomyces noursei]GGX17485.1 hypothetical protein GCM10010341_43710 [Streptomyces noursei]